MTQAESQLSPIEDIIEEARNGRMYILVDAEDRENEGDLVIPAQFATPEAVNFMARFGRGLICLPLSRKRAGQLDLAPMTRQNQARNRTAFTVSIEAREGIDTGISAHDRAHSIAVAIDPEKGANDIVSPGHVFPLVAKDGGVLVRAGHTEAAVDISRLAGLYPAGVICEIMKDDGTMARLPDLVEFAREHGLKIGAISDLIAYRRKHDNYVERVLSTEIGSRFGGDFHLHVYRNTVDGTEHAALVAGDLPDGKPALVRVHKVDFGSDLLGVEPGREDLVARAMRMIAEEEEGGVVVLIRDTEPGALTKRFQNGGAEEEDEDTEIKRYREIGVGSQILRDLGVSEMTLLTDTPQKLVGLEGYGLKVSGWRNFRGNTHG